VKHFGPTFRQAVEMLVEAAYPKSGQVKDLHMPGDPHYQPEELRPYLGYDMRVSWQIIVAWFWLVTLAKFGLMPKSTARLLTGKLLRTMLVEITTTRVTKLEKEKTNHDILALLELMRSYMPVQLHRYLHLGLTSYDLISTAYAVQFIQTFLYVFYPKACQLDEQWRSHIRKYARSLQMARTHLQDALPITAGFWLAGRHSRFVYSVKMAKLFAKDIPGKFSGAVGAKAAILALSGGKDLEAEALTILELPTQRISTQITPAEPMERFFHELKLISGTLAQLGEDVRHLQASSVGEVSSLSSTSSTMSHKGANPIAAENLAGMYRSVVGETIKVMLNQQSDLGRDLRDSNVMRGYAATIVFAYKQLQTAYRLMKSFKLDEDKCLNNFWVNGKLVTAELLHLSLQRAGYQDAHSFVNQVIVPAARQSRNDLAREMDAYVSLSKDRQLRKAWKKVPRNIYKLLANPDNYIGQAVSMARDEADNELF